MKGNAALAVVGTHDSGERKIGLTHCQQHQVTEQSRQKTWFYKKAFSFENVRKGDVCIHVSPRPIMSLINTC